MAAGNLSPRQKMINMMYLVLTALLALNVSKEVLNSFFEVNKGIERSTMNFNTKNGDTYSEFINAAENNPAKYNEVKENAFAVKNQADALSLKIQKMKYDLVMAVDGEVYLGKPTNVIDPETDKPREELAIKEKTFEQLSNEQKLLPIGYLNVKDNRDKSGAIFLSKTVKKEKQAAYILSSELTKYRDFLIEMADSNQSLIDNINQVCDVSKVTKKGGEKQDWEIYNFYDMPSVGALTILSKIQSDLRNIESDVINYLKKNIDAKALKFTSAEGVAIPSSNFVIRGDSFRAAIFITAKNEEQNPDIYVGEYDSLGGGQYEMIGTEGVDYEKVKVVNGKGMYATKTTTEGSKEWGGLIAMKTETGTKFYPFGGQYLVASKTAVVSPVYMNILYEKVDNPLSVSVAGFSGSEITAVIDNGNINATKKSAGEYNAYPTKVGKAIVSLFVTNDGKRVKMGQMDFRVKKVPPPKPEVKFSTMVNGELFIDKTKMQTAGGISAVMEDFDFKGIRYVITSYKLTGTYKGEQQSDLSKGPGFTDKMIAIIKNTRSGNQITISNIKAKRVDAKDTKVETLDPLILVIK